MKHFFKLDHLIKIRIDFLLKKKIENRLVDDQRSIEEHQLSVRLRIKKF